MKIEITEAFTGYPNGETRTFEKGEIILASSLPTGFAAELIEKGLAKEHVEKKGKAV